MPRFSYKTFDALSTRQKHRRRKIMQKQLEDALDAANLNVSDKRDAVQDSPSFEHPPKFEKNESEDSADEHSDPVHHSMLFKNEDDNSTYSGRVQQPTMIIKTERDEIPEVGFYNPSSVYSESSSDGQHTSNTVQQPMFRNDYEGPVPTFSNGRDPPAHQSLFRNEREGPRDPGAVRQPLINTTNGGGNGHISCCCGQPTCQSNLSIQKIQSDVSLIKYYVEGMATNKKRRLQGEPDSVIKRFKFPISSVQDFNALDDELRVNETSRAQLIEYISIHCGGPYVKDCIYQGLTSLVAGEVAGQYNWVNRTGGKIPMRDMYFLDLMLDVLLQKPDIRDKHLATSVNVKKVIKKWFALKAASNARTPSSQK